jgi:hypothetical protein
MKKISLSFQDHFLLAFEREDLPFNTHFYFETQSPIQLDQFERYKETFLKFIQLELQLQISCDYKTGKITHHKLSDEQVLQACMTLNSLEDENRFIESHFRYLIDPPVKLAHFQNKLIFSFHHPLFDGHAQMVFLKDFFDLYHGKDIRPRTLKSIIKFRYYFLKTPLLWYFKHFISQIFQPKAKKQKISRLFDREPLSRKIDYMLLEFEKRDIDLILRKLKLSYTAFYSLCAICAFDKLQSERGDNDNPIVVFIPKTLRAELKAENAFQNLIGFIWMKLSRDKITDPSFPTYFRTFYKFRSSPEEIRKVLFMAAIITKLSSFQKLKKMLLHKENKIHDCSLLISSGRTPKEILIPEELKDAKFFGRGTMHRSPGIALLITSNNHHDFISIEYLKDAFNESTILNFKKLLEQEINSHRSCP